MFAIFLFLEEKASLEKNSVIDIPGRVFILNDPSFRGDMAYKKGRLKAPFQKLEVV